MSLISDVLLAASDSGVKRNTVLLQRDLLLVEHLHFLLEVVNLVDVLLLALQVVLL